jgi:hypothetical protein
VFISVPDQGENDDDRNWHAKQPKQNSATHRLSPPFWLLQRFDTAVVPPPRGSPTGGIETLHFRPGGRRARAGRRAGSGFQPAMVRAQSRAFALSVTPGNRRCNSTPADISPSRSKAARIAAASSSLTANMPETCGWPRRSASTASEPRDPARRGADRGGSPGGEPESAAEKWTLPSAESQGDIHRPRVIQWTLPSAKVDSPVATRSYPVDSAVETNS